MTLYDKNNPSSICALFDSIAFRYDLVNALLSFKSGNAKGRSTIKWVMEEPSGIRGPEQLLPALFEGEDRGVNFILNLALTLSQEGLYWFDVFLEEQLLTRIPLRIFYQRIGPQRT